MRSCNLKAYAKINLGLDVTGKREDGYHEVRMIMQTVNLYDTLFIKEIERNAIVIKTNKAFLPVNESNIVYKAASLMKETYGIEKGFFIDLKKHIPVAAGMAGGSADAAATMVGINNMFRLGIPMSRLMELGVKIGADVPYCIMRGTALAEGIGEKLTRLDPMPECQILIAKPPISVSTRSVYGKLDLSKVTHPDIDGMIESLKAGSLSGISSRLMNVLESVTEGDHPVITEYKEEMVRLGSSGSLMSGSGPTVFGIFEDRDSVLAAKAKFKEKYPAAHVCLTRPFNLRVRNDKH
ncbi:MAG: 4-(cytidine 5'-diphospho)-2-C-methyl-D-erythritol kinase [Lachnospiraceae bacterium]|nr:4-(cytidine 5'-diphospho)-2-C-methyl-D-erythritol kinase [Lachnospiraceae bacterium]